jgi:predicted aldo/keto reductase-like oxidoreductase
VCLPSLYPPISLTQSSSHKTSYLNEDEVGSALKEWLARNPDAKREDIFITTKVWPHLMEPEDIEWSLNNSLKMLGLEYVDCFLLHWPFVCEKTEEKTVRLGSDNKVLPPRCLSLPTNFGFGANK